MLNDILLPIDLQHEVSWKDALPMALKLLAPGGRLHLLGIVHDVGNAWVASYLPKGYEKKALEAMKADLGSFAAREVGGDVTVKTHVGHGHVAETILKMARKTGAQMIVMASQRPDQLRTFRVGSQADRVVHHSPISVLVVR